MTEALLKSHLATQYIALGRVADAEAIAREAIATLERINGPEHGGLYVPLTVLSQALTARFEHAEAEATMKRALAISEKANGPRHLLTVEALGYYAVTLDALGRGTEAEQLQRRAIEITESMFGPDHPSLVGSLANLADRLQQQGRLYDAEPVARRAVSLGAKLFGPDQVENALPLSALGVVLAGLNRNDEAQPILQRALDLREHLLGPDHSLVGTSLSNLALVKSALGQTAEAEALYKRAISLSERTLGPESIELDFKLNNLGLLYFEQLRYKDAEDLFRRALRIKEKALGPDHPTLIVTLQNLARTLTRLNRFPEADALVQRGIAVATRAYGPDSVRQASSLTNLGELRAQEGRFREAEEAVRRALALNEKALGKDHPSLAGDLGQLGTYAMRLGHYEDAERMMRRAIEIREKAVGVGHASVAADVYRLAALLRVEGRTSEAEQLGKRAVAILEAPGKQAPAHLAYALHTLSMITLDQSRSADGEQLARRAIEVYEANPSIAIPPEVYDNLAASLREQGRILEAEQVSRRALTAIEARLGPEHPDAAVSLNNLALILRQEGRAAEAEALYLRSIDIMGRTLGVDHPLYGLPNGNLGNLYADLGRFREAEPFLKRALENNEKTLGPDHPNVAFSLIGMGYLYQRTGNRRLAEAYYQRTLQLGEKLFGPEHRIVVSALSGLADLQMEAGNASQAQQLFRRAIALGDKALGPDDPTMQGLHFRLATTAFAAGDLPTALQAYDTATEGVTRRVKRNIERREMSSKDASMSAICGYCLGVSIKAIYRFGEQNPSAKEALTAKAFAIAQWARDSEAAASLAEMATRSAKGDTRLAQMVRERQDLSQEWRLRDKQLLAATSTPLAQRDSTAESSQRSRLAEIGGRVAQIDAVLARDFPDYAALSNPEPMRIADVQAQLGANEALVLLLDTAAMGLSADKSIIPEETSVWVVTKTETRWLRSEAGAGTLSHTVAALRCGLDATAWAVGNDCASLLRLPPDGAPPRPLPFNATLSHQLYKSLFGQVEDLIRGKHLLLVPSGSLTQIPFQVLVTEPPQSGDLRSVKWLVRTNALTVLPAVSSLGALRRVGRPSAATKPMIGFGNPLLDGPDAAYADAAKQARDRQACPETRFQRIATLLRGRASSAPIKTRGGIVDVDDIKMQIPLPETADELCAVARDIKADPRELRLGARATEQEIKALSRGGELANYRILHFATHGMLAGQIDGASEPGLILTPPLQPTSEDDGYLSASEIAELKLDADWVILSACNTAAGGAGGAEALSGLARAFFYAQARALLVSHWEVDSEATVALITTTVGEIGKNRTIGRAEATRRAMLAMIDHGKPHEAHPTYWAPFVLVGEGAAGR